MPVNTNEFLELGKRFIFQGGSPYAISLANEIDKLRAENKQLREANEAFGRLQEWWTERMFELEEAVLAEREACIEILSRTEFTSLEHMPSEAALLIRAREGDA